jgi:hypothetical protein
MRLYVVLVPDGSKHIFKDKDGPDVVRCVAHPSQLSIMDEWRGIRPVEVISISHLHKSMPLSEVCKVLPRIDRPPEAGGWRKLADMERAALAFGAYGAADLLTGGVDDMHILAEGHPAFRGGFGWPYGGDMLSTALVLLGTMYDIFRFTHPTQSVDDVTCLHESFQLSSPALFHRLLDAGFVDDRTMRPGQAFLAWFPHPFGCGDPRRVDACPEAFLFRGLRRHKEDALADGLHEAAANRLAMYHVTRHYLEFVRETWLSGLGVRPFAPERFFTREDEVESFRAYMKRIDNPLDNRPWSG